MGCCRCLPATARSYLSPATWGLSDAGVVVRVTGLEPVLKSLASEGLTVMVEGRWRRWDGPIGCGNTAVESTVFFLQAVQILYPNPLARATFTPLGAVPEGTASGIEVVITAGTDLTPPPGTPRPSPTSGSYPLATPSPTSLDSPLPTLRPPASPSVSPTPSPTSQDSPLATPTTTLFPTFTPLPDSTASPSPTASVTPGGQTRDMGILVREAIKNATLVAGDSHSWEFDGVGGEVVTISSGPAADLDVELVLRNPQGVQVATRNLAAAGGTETMESLTLSQTGRYEILVKGVQGDGGSYALVLLDSASTPILFPGNLALGDLKASALPAEAQHVWHFTAAAGTVITIRVSPISSIDLSFALYGPTDMDNPIEVVDGGDVDEPEESTFNLSVSGFFSIAVQEYSGLPGTYQVSLLQD